MSTFIPCKRKWRFGLQYKKNMYRARTGPDCCNSGCRKRRIISGRIK